MDDYPRTTRDMSFAERKNVWLQISDITEAQFDALQAHWKERQAGLPLPGSEAPDFEIDVMGSDQKRTGETVRLSSLRGKPVGLIFGSWT